MSTIDYTKDQKTILFDLINQVNNIILSPADFEVTEPTVYLGDRPDVNTAIIIKALAGTGYYGERELFYQRIDISEVFSGSSLQYNPQLETKLSELLPRINATYGLHLKVDDIYETTIPPFDPVNPYAIRDVIFQVKPSSLFFKGTYTFSFGLVNQPVVENDGLARTYYLVVDGYGINEVKSGLVSLNSDGTPNLDFNYLSNVNNIVTFDRQQIFRKVNGQFVLNGQFSFDYVDADQNVVSISDAASLTINADGRVISHSSALFCDGLAVKFYTDPKVPFYYFNSSRTNLNSNVSRYTEAGVLDINFTPAIQYEPTLIRITPDNKIYTLSKAMLIPDPYNSNVLVVQRRLDRMLSDGSFDPEFDPVYLRASNPTYQPLPVFDIAISETNGFYIVFNPVYSLDVGSPCPIINGHPLADIDSTGKTLYAWNPVVSFNADGSQVLTYRANLKNLNGASIYNSQLSPLVEDSAVLVTRGGKTTFMTFSENPITGFRQQRPIQFDTSGQLKFLSGQEYLDQYKWTAMKDVKIQQNGEILAFGLIQTIQQSGSYSAPYSALVRYQANTTIDQVLWRAFGPTGTSNPILNQIFFDEK